MANAQRREWGRDGGRKCTIPVMVACSLFPAGCSGLTGSPGGPATLGALIDTLIPSGNTPTNDNPFNDVMGTGLDDQPTGDDGTETPPPGEAVVEDDEFPDNAYCNAVAAWPAADVAFEDEVLTLVNQRRAAGADCGSGGTFGPTDPLTSAGDLRCAARNHSLDMATRGFFDHTNPDGDGPGQRLDDAGFSGFTWGENIAWGQRTPQEVVDGWMDSDGHCRNIMNPDFTETGIGYDESNYWTQVFGAR